MPELRSLRCACKLSLLALVSLSQVKCLSTASLGAIILQVRLEKSRMFHPNQAMSCLQMLHVRGMREGLSAQERMHVLNTMMSLSATQQVTLPSNIPIPFTMRSNFAQVLTL